MSQFYRLGIDLGGTNTALMVLDIRQIESPNRGVLARADFKTNYKEGYLAVAQDISHHSLLCLKEAGVKIEDVAYAGIGSPGVIDSDKGVIIFSSNLKFKQAPLAQALENLLDLKVYLGNDANLAALGELKLGAAKGTKDAVIITLGTGVGGGVFVNSTPLLGFNGGAAELGHHVINVHGRPCNCGRQGCWETYASATGLLQTCFEILPAFSDSLLNKETNIQGRIEDCRIIFTAYDKKDEAALKIMDEYLKMLAIGMVNIVNLFQPEIIALSGGLSARSDVLIPYLEKALADQVYAFRQLTPTKILPALLGNDAGLFGAALIADL